VERDAHESDRPRRRFGRTYTYLMNGTAPAGNWTGLFRPARSVRLRFINGSSDDDLRCAHSRTAMSVVAADGQDVEPVASTNSASAAAETYDVIVEPRDDVRTRSSPSRSIAPASRAPRWRRGRHARPMCRARSTRLARHARHDGLDGRGAAMHGGTDGS
jgi:FtsP/CotA-like multicopper oxidase with cupredoxin domain